MAVEVLAIVDPTRMPTLLQKWLEAMDRETAHEEKSSFNRVVQAQELYFPLAQLLANTVPQHVDEIHGKIVQRCLDVFDAAHHCYLCKILADFLNDGTRFSLRSLHVPALCDAAQGCIEVNRHRLKLHRKARTSYYDIIKVPLEGGAGEGQLYELGVTQRQHAEDRTRVAVLDTIVADDQRRPATDGDTPHQHCVKRQRRSFSYR
ncbi:hypothetical protein SPRG_16249 [Saprolegnia parasitica CBS 223.65]|uniref:Uncharacterized protein n=1 Tax=Saprolegnia parasitica (strain CBS 223.65) TaxID=695850 RepID=A0A067BVP5_SAPPC|nr:hypothetical protein SPRG_16249 [Saprolegnia parasitica CBS 223.65]KDO18361.1 hypothetical protein SPRG_16249 [Saprolegnia parasitica CBS 223.65]|eukprot:XP_012210933.1 hypothetical protein SPRG_16249 [Saprolegnia parasitica CBS 223.65]